MGQTEMAMVGHAEIAMMGHIIESHLHRNPWINAALTSFVMVGHLQVVMVGHRQVVMVGHGKLMYVMCRIK